MRKIFPKWKNWFNCQLYIPVEKSLKIKLSCLSSLVVVSLSNKRRQMFGLRGRGDWRYPKPPKGTKSCDINWKYSKHLLTNTCCILSAKMIHEYESWRKQKTNNSWITMYKNIN